MVCVFSLLVMLTGITLGADIKERTGSGFNRMMGEMDELQTQVADLAAELAKLKEQLETPSKRCPTEFGFKNVGSSCYWTSKITETWFNAKVICQHMGGHLATFASVEEITDVKAYVDKETTALYIYVGGSDLAKDSLWMWEGGQEIEHKDWQSGQPNNYGGQEACLTLGRHTGHKWNDAKCNEEKVFMCEISD